MIERNYPTQCPICKGKGQINAPLGYGKRTPDNRIMAKLLRGKGYSIREIMRFLGYKSPQSVAELIKIIK